MDSNRPKVSVIVPVWGVEKYIEKCARSLFEQTLDDLEIVFVDDCTPDKSIEILKRVLLDYPNRKDQTKIVSYEKNRGLPQARKAGFEVSEGEYITYCDSDDWVASDMYEALFIKAKEKDYDMVFCDFVYQTDDKVLWAPSYDSSKTSAQLRQDVLSMSISNSTWTKLVHRRVYEKGIYFPTIAMDEDDVLTSQMAYYSKTVGYVKRCLYFHYANPDSMTHVVSEEKKRKNLQDKVTNRKWIIDFYEKQGDESLAYPLFKYKWSVKQLSVELDGKSARGLYPEVNKDMVLGKGLTLKRRIMNFTILYMPGLWQNLKKRAIE